MKVRYAAAAAGLLLSACSPKSSDNLNTVEVTFPNGKTVLVARLLPGQHATVLQLPAMPHKASQVERPEAERGNNPATFNPSPPSQVKA